MSKRLATEQLLVSLWRRAIVHARIKLVSDNLTRAQRDYLWQSIDCREWLIMLVAKDYEAELEQIDRELEAEFRRGPRAVKSDETTPVRPPPV